MNRELVNFMNTENNLKRTNNFKNNSEINSKNTSIYNIRRNENGLYFNLKIVGENEKNISDLFIPAKFYQQNIVSSKQKDLIIISKSKLVEYFLIYPSAIASLILIISTFFKYLPTLKNLFNMSGF